MPRLETVDHGVIFRNPLPGHRVNNAFNPDVLCLPGGDWLCVLRIGAAMYSPDGVLELFRSSDAGVTWHRQGRLTSSAARPAGWNECDGTLALLRDGSIVLRVMSCDLSAPDRLAYNPATQGLAPLETSFWRSFDGGHSWTGPAVADVRAHFPHQEAAPYGRVIEQADGTWFHAFETWKTYDDAGPFDLNSYGMFSRDGGRTWHDKTPIAVGTGDHRSYSHGIPAALHDGRIWISMWAAEPQLQKFFPLVAVTSRDGTFREWSSPAPLGIPGQTSCSVELRPGRLLIVYSHREGTDQPGIKAVLSEDGGRTWSLDAPLTLWDAYGKEALGVARTSTYPSGHDAIAYGAPKITRIDDDHALACFWCTQGGDTHARWCVVRAFV